MVAARLRMPVLHTNTHTRIRVSHTPGAWGGDRIIDAAAARTISLERIRAANHGEPADIPLTQGMEKFGGESIYPHQTTIRFSRGTQQPCAPSFVPGPPLSV